MLYKFIIGVVLGALSAVAQINTDQPTYTPTGTPVSLSATATPCAAISSYLAEAAGTGPAATALPINAGFAYECLLSVPLVKTDALAVIDALTDVYQAQSTLAYLKDPPPEYPLAGVDLIGELADLRSQVDGGEITSEILFQTNISTIMARTYDGHVGYQMDASNVFYWERPFGSIISLSLNGDDIPKIYILSEVIDYNYGRAYMPSAITQINGVDVTEFLTTSALNGTTTSFQDPDTLFNNQLYSTNSGLATVRYNPGLFASPLTYPGEMTTLTFENGTESSGYNTAFTLKSFEGVFDGPSFYSKFCEPQNKSYRRTRTLNKKDLNKRQTAAITQLPAYPPPVIISDDGAASGYFLTAEGYEDVAVLVLTFMTMTAQQSFQSTVSDFFALCRTQGKNRLVLDITGNPGGAVILGYDTFKQLFPDLEPYGTGNWRAYEALNEIGQLVTDAAQQAKDDKNETLFNYIGGNSDYNARFYNNDSGSPFNSWEDRYGPVQIHGDNFTHLYRWNYNNYPRYENIAIGISGYQTPSAPQPFDPENIVIIGDGRCSSTCTILSHLLKWQAKVKSIAYGGRPANGPMQSQGGVKGSQAMNVRAEISTIDGYVSLLPPDQQQKLTGGAYEKWSESAFTLLQRGRDYDSENYDTSENVALNSRNNIREGDTSTTPLQFVYEAADCRLWYTMNSIGAVQVTWYDAATTAFGLNGTTPWARCIEGSTNAPSSLSGNATLYNDGKPNNVTSFITQKDGVQDGAENGAGQMKASSSLVLAVVITAVVVLGL